MEITEISGLGKLSFPLPIYVSKTIATASHNGEEFEIVAGLDKKNAEEVRKRSLDESDTELQQNTSDKKRFGEGSYENWYAKGRTPFALIHKKSGALAALVWFGPKPLSRKSLKYLSEGELKNENRQNAGEWHTLVYRSYNPFRGKGLMKEFAGFVMDVYSAKHPGIRYWAGISAENKPSIALASFLGFAASEKDSDPSANWIAMVK